MIVVRVELWSAVNGRKTELARMHIANDGRASVENPRRGSYDGQTFVGRSAQALDRLQVSRRGRVEDFPRQDLHIWNLVAAMLKRMGYDRGAPSAPDLFDANEIRP